MPDGAQWLHEIKWDGYRLIAFLRDGKARLQTRNGLDWTRRFPGIAKAVAALPVDTAILDGEAVIEDESGASSFAALQQALSRDTNTVAADAVFYAFDLLYVDGADLRSRPLGERKERLAGLVPSGTDGTLRLSEHLEANGSAMVRHACRLGLEGVISKRRDRPYRSGRTEDWVKTKCTDRQEFVIVGYVPSTAVKNAIGSLVLGMFEAGTLVYAGRTGTGFTADLARDLAKRLDPLRTAAPPFGAKLTADQRRGVVWVRPELVGEVEFRGWTAERVVRHAAFKGLREDKSAREVVREDHLMSAKRSGGTKANGKPAAKASARKGAAVPSVRDGEVAGVRLTHPDRVLWEEQGLTKQGLAEFYVGVADWILPHIVDRPLALVRCPSGQEKGCFFQKHSWAGLDAHVAREMVRDEDGEEEVLLVRDIRGVVALVQAGVLEIHPWGATLDDIEQPGPHRCSTSIPSEDVPGRRSSTARASCASASTALGLESFVKTTGGKGLHVVVPLHARRRLGRGQGVRARRSPRPWRRTARTAISRRPRRRPRRARSSSTTCATAAARPRLPPTRPAPARARRCRRRSPGTSSRRRIRSNHFTVSNLPARLGALRKDPWAELWTVKQTLPKGQGRRKRR